LVGVGPGVAGDAHLGEPDILRHRLSGTNGARRNQPPAGMESEVDRCAVGLYVPKTSSILFKQHAGTHG
jgi:hypothetical protein